MAKRTLMVVAMLFLFAAVDASASCVGCMYQTCTNRFGKDVEAAQCMPDNVDYGQGIANCKNVSSCGGCMGWSCSREGDVPMAELVPEKTTVVAAKRATADHDAQ